MDNTHHEYYKVVEELDKKLGRMIPNQVTDRTRVDHGGYFSPDLGFASPYHLGNALYLTLLGTAYYAPGSRYYKSKGILQRILSAAHFQERCQRPSGFFDLPYTNFDSPTDTAFSVSSMAKILWMGRQRKDVDGLEQIENVLGPLLISSAKAISSGGFHTPNHRWVIVSALAQMMELYPDLDLSGSMDSYLAEGIDVNEDGMYSERSSGGYNAVCNRHLIQAAEILNRPDIFQAVRENLNSMIYLFHDDWTIFSNVSLRQDKGKKTIPVNALDGFYYMARKDNNEHFSYVANALFRKGGSTNYNLLYWFARHPEYLETKLSEGKPNSDFSRHFKASGLWRVRRGKLSATVATGIPEALSLKYGQTELKGLMLHCPYFAGAHFKGHQLLVEGHSARLTLKSDFFLPQLPGYWEPLGRPVPHDDLPYENLHEREVNPRPEFTFQLTVTEVDKGFDLSVQTEEGMIRVPFTLEFLFEPPGQIEMENASIPASSDTIMFHKSGYLTYRNDEDALTIGPGFYGHRVVKCNPAAGLMKVVMSDWTHVTRTVQVRYGRWTEAEGECCSHKGPGAGFA